jgi:hypothetical protein
MHPTALYPTLSAPAAAETDLAHAASRNRRWYCWPTWPEISVAILPERSHHVHSTSHARVWRPESGRARDFSSWSGRGCGRACGPRACGPRDGAGARTPRMPAIPVCSPPGKENGPTSTGRTAGAQPCEAAGRPAAALGTACTTSRAVIKLGAISKTQRILPRNHRNGARPGLDCPGHSRINTFPTLLTTPQTHSIVVRAAEARVAWTRTKFSPQSRCLLFRYNECKFGWCRHLLEVPENYGASCAASLQYTAARQSNHCRISSCY